MTRLKTKYLSRAGGVITLAVLALAAAPPPASASITPPPSSTYNFTIDHCSGSGGCFGTATSLGTVTVSDSGSEVNVDVQLAQGIYFLNTGLGATFGFNIAGNPSITDQSLPTGWTLNSTSAGAVHMDGFGDFGYGVDCNSPVCGTGGSGATSNPTSLSFNISGNFDAADLAALSSGGSPSVFFAADVYSSLTGNTGPIGAVGEQTTVPEPATLALFAVGLALLGLALRRRARRH